MSTKGALWPSLLGSWLHLAPVPADGGASRPAVEPLPRPPAAAMAATRSEPARRDAAWRGISEVRIAGES